MTTYLPAGTYVVSDTLSGKAIGQVAGCLTHTSIGSLSSVPQSPSIVGPASGPRPTIQLTDAAAGFADATNPKPVLFFWDYANPCPSGEQCDTWQGQPDCLMWAVIRDVDVTLGSGNAGAVGIRFAAAQYSYIENVSVDATGGYAGMQGIPTAEVVVNVAVNGGAVRHHPHHVLRHQSGRRHAQGADRRGPLARQLRRDHGDRLRHPRRRPEAAVLNKYFAVADEPGRAMLDGNNPQVSGSPAPAIDNSLPGTTSIVGNVYFETSGPSRAERGRDAGRGNRSNETTCASTPSPTPQSIHPERGDRQIEGVGHGRRREGAGADRRSRHFVGHASQRSGPAPSSGPASVVSRTQASSTSPPSGPIHRRRHRLDRGHPEGDRSERVRIPSARGLPHQRDAESPARIPTCSGVPGMRSRIFGTNWNPQGQYQPFIQTADTATRATHVGDLLARASVSSGEHVPQRARLAGRSQLHQAASRRLSAVGHGHHYRAPPSSFASRERRRPVVRLAALARGGGVTIPAGVAALAARRGPPRLSPSADPIPSTRE